MGQTFPRDSLISHYRIISKLGEGGMAEVYLAQDTKLGRRVAMKFLPQQTSGDQQAQKRLIREAQAVATLEHQNICAIYEIGEADGHNFIVMQYVEGETLHKCLQERALDVPTALALAVQIADALVEAHSRGIIHRDLKPQNIMITSRQQARVMDFGLAKVMNGEEVVESEARTQSLLTTPGAVIGTVPYMSPEQVRGERIDERSDIFSFGVLVYEMLTGCQPFVAGSSIATISSILTKEPEPIHQYVPACPIALEHLVRKCLVKEKERRYQTMRDVATDLQLLYGELDTGREMVSTSLDLTTVNRGIADTARTTQTSFFNSHRIFIATGALFLLIVAAILAYFWTSRRATTARSPEISALAVLPLENLSGDPAQDYFADGMTEALINNLTQIKAFNRVISRTTMMRYKDSRKSLPEIAKELNVDAVIEGTVQRAGGRVVVTAKLIPAATDSPLWAREYDRDLSDVLKLQAEVARSIADEVRIQVTADERARFAAVRSINPQAHELYLLGRFHLSKNNPEDWAEAIKNFAGAKDLVPDYAEAYAGLSDALLQQAIFGIRPFKEAVPPARDAALKAIGLNEGLAEAHTSLANIKYYYDWDWAGAEKELNRALELNPGNLTVRIAYGHFLHVLGRHNEAVREGRLAVELDPLSAEAHTSLGRFLYRARRYEEALPVLQRAVQLEPRSSGANNRLAGIYTALGRYTEALAVYEKAKEVAPSATGYRDVVAYVYARMGRKQEARQTVSGTTVFPVDVAGVYAALGDKDAAFRILEKAVEERNALLVTVKEEPPLESLHSDPRWQKLLSKMNFPPS
jgi:eukaryotic-like serine/threonine-protein kinase